MTSATRSMLGQTPLLMLIDGHALVHRAFHAFRDPLHVQSTGEEVSAVFGFLNMLLRAREDWQPTHCAVAFDLPGPTFRHAEYDEYKAHRPARSPGASLSARARAPARGRVRNPHLRGRGLRGRRRAGQPVQAGRGPTGRNDRPVRRQRPATASVAAGSRRPGVHREGPEGV